MQAFVVNAPKSHSRNLLEALGTSLQQTVASFGDRICDSVLCNQEAIQIERKECHGVITWQVFHQVTKERQVFTLESEVCAWVERQYRH